MNKVVAAFLDGRRLKGLVYNFSAESSAFDLLPPENPLQERGVRVEMKELKAIFFVKDLTGQREDHALPTGEPPLTGRTIEVTFSDGEKVLGRTEAYNPRKLGFFMSPTDPKSNNLRIFIINKNVSNIGFR
jgi:hypothetical protein